MFQDRLQLLVDISVFKLNSLTLFLDCFYTQHLYICRTTLPTDLDAMVDPLPPNSVADLYDGIYNTDWQIANKALLNDKVNQEQAASKLIKILVVSLHLLFNWYNFRNITFISNLIYNCYCKQHKN